MGQALDMNPMRHFPIEPATRRIAAELFEGVERLPIVSPHGHVDPIWFAYDAPFENATEVFLKPDHYLLRMLYSQGVGLNELGLAANGLPVQRDPRVIWRRFAQNYRLFRGTPSRIWLDHAFATIFNIHTQLSSETADLYFDSITEALATREFRPRALFERFRIESIATTEGALDLLEHHKAIRSSGWGGKVITTFRPDDVVDPEREDFAENLGALAQLTGEDVTGWQGYLAALRKRRAYFREVGGATATDHGHPSARTQNLDADACQALLEQVAGGRATPDQAEQFRAQMLTEMARMACEDGMTMQLHPGSWRNHNPWLFRTFGRDRGADIPQRVSFTDGLKPLLDEVGNRSDLTLILFTLDESNYARELAPLAGHYPCLRLGPAWWFHDSPEGMMRYRRQITETAGFYNTVGFNDDTRAFFSIPARHDLARRMDCSYLAELVVTHRISKSEAQEVVVDLTYNLPKAAYKL